MNTDYDLFVIGGGSGGVRCARIAAGYGAKVGIAEGRFWGGTCVNVGCVPKKIMVQAAEYGAFARDAVGFGWEEFTPIHDWSALIAAKDREISRLNAIYVRLLEGAGVTIHEHWARLVDAHTIDVRFWERGAGETNSSGTGATGAAVAAVARGFAASPVSVITPAGPLALRMENQAVYLTGPAEVIADGVFHYGKINGND